MVTSVLLKEWTGLSKTILLRKIVCFLKLVSQSTKAASAYSVKTRDNTESKTSANLSHRETTTGNVETGSSKWDSGHKCGYSIMLQPQSLECDCSVKSVEATYAIIL